MAVPIADDWKAIHDRMQQIRAEQAGFSRPCSECNGLGWIPQISDRRHPQTVGYAICGLYENPTERPPPRHVAGR
jgi:hypothetical protein